MKTIYITYNPIHLRNCGGSVNDGKFFSALSKIDKAVVPLYPKGEHFLVFYLRILKKVLRPGNLFIIRGTWTVMIPAFFKPLLHHRLVYYAGCTPLVFLENEIWSMNDEYQGIRSIKNRVLCLLDRFISLNALKTRADLIFAENARARRILRRYGIEERKVILLPYYIEDYFFKNSIRAEFNPASDTFQLGYTGRFLEYDKLGPVLDALSVLKQEGLTFQFTLIGDGPNKTKYEDQAKTLGIDKEVVFVGVQPHETVSKLMDRFHCLILPLVENILPSTVPIKMLEAVLKGKIVITNKSGNIPSLFSGHNDLVLASLEMEGIKDAIKNVVGNYSHHAANAANIQRKQVKLHDETSFHRILARILTHMHRGSPSNS